MKVRQPLPSGTRVSLALSRSLTFPQHSAPDPLERQRARVRCIFRDRDQTKILDHTFRRLARISADSFEEWRALIQLLHS